LLFLGMAIGPALTGVYLESDEPIDGVSGTYPSQESYNLVYITSGLLSAASLASVLMLKKRAHKMEIEVR
jgi:hypothetical protein